MTRTPSVRRRETRHHNFRNAWPTANANRNNGYVLKCRSRRARAIPFRLSQPPPCGEAREFSVQKIRGWGRLPDYPHPKFARQISTSRKGEVEFLGTSQFAGISHKTKAGADQRRPRVTLRCGLVSVQRLHLHDLMPVIGADPQRVVRIVEEHAP